MPASLFKASSSKSAGARRGRECADGAARAPFGPSVFSAAQSSLESASNASWQRRKSLGHDAQDRSSRCPATQPATLRHAIWALSSDPNALHLASAGVPSEVAK